MISVWWLLLIIPATCFFTLLALALCRVAGDSDEKRTKEKRNGNGN
ncbi:MAG: hypothetical protein ACOX63_03220 [Christensenellales bacterium]|jgi:hypothetical protein